MDELCLHIPKDFESRTSFRMLEAAIGKLTATAWWLLLWRDLAYAAQSNPLGVLPTPQAELFNSLQPEGERPLDILRRCDNLLVPVEGGLYCALFAAQNKHLAPDHVSMQRVGGKKRGVEARARQIETEASQQATLLDPKLFTRPDGQTMSPDETRRTVMLVRLLDHYLGQPSRLQMHFSQGLVQDAWQALRKYDEDTIMRFCTWLTLRRESGQLHPAIPNTTEEILREFDKYVNVKL